MQKSGGGGVGSIDGGCGGYIGGGGCIGGGYIGVSMGVGENRLSSVIGYRLNFTQNLAGFSSGGKCS